MFVSSNSTCFLNGGNSLGPHRHHQWPHPNPHDPSRSGFVEFSSVTNFRLEVQLTGHQHILKNRLVYGCFTTLTATVYPSKRSFIILFKRWRHFLLVKNLVDVLFSKPNFQGRDPFFLGIGGLRVPGIHDAKFSQKAL